EDQLLLLAGLTSRLGRSVHELDARAERAAGAALGLVWGGGRPGALHTCQNQERGQEDPGDTSTIEPAHGSDLLRTMGSLPFMTRPAREKFVTSSPRRRRVSAVRVSRS